MAELLLSVLYSLAFSLPIAFFSGIGYVLLAVLALKVMGLSEVRDEATGFFVLASCFFLSIFTFLVSFAYFCRSF